VNAHVIFVFSSHLKMDIKIYQANAMLRVTVQVHGQLIFSPCHMQFWYRTPLKSHFLLATFLCDFTAPDYFFAWLALCNQR
jgi:hypothetical protein